MLYRLLTKSVTPGALGLLNPSWVESVRVISLVINTWHNDRRPERFEKPHIIDVGWTDVMLPEYLASGRATETAHLKMKGALQNEKGNAVHSLPTSISGFLTIYFSPLCMESLKRALLRILCTHVYERSSNMTLQDVVFPLWCWFTRRRWCVECSRVLGLMLGHSHLSANYSGAVDLRLTCFFLLPVFDLNHTTQIVSSRRMSSRSPSPRRLNTGPSHSSRDYVRRSKYEPDDDVKPLYVKQEDHRLSSVSIKEEDKKGGSSHQDGLNPLPAACIVNIQTLVRTLMRADQTGPSVPATALRLNIPANPLLPCAGNECQ